MRSCDLGVLPQKDSLYLCQNRHLKSIEAAGLRIAEAIAAYKTSGENAKAYFVGGWCASKLTQTKCEDLDMEVAGVSRDELYNILDSLFPSSVVYPSKNTAAPFKVLLANNQFIDITLPIVGSNLTLNATIAESASRRDFTCNAIYYDPVAEKWHDPFGGIDDLKKGILRGTPLIQNLPEITAVPIRACRYAAKYSLEIDPNTAGVLRDAAKSGVMDGLPKAERTKEAQKLLCDLEYPSHALRIADSLGILDKFFPYISRLKDTPQPQLFHPEGSVFEHIMLVVDQAAKLSRELEKQEKFALMLSALYHDCGKFETTAITQAGNKKTITAHSHEIKSAEILKSVLKSFDIARPYKTLAIKFTAEHMKPLSLSNRHSSGLDGYKYDNEVRKLVRSIGPDRFGSFILLCRSDLMGRGIENPELNMEKVLGPLLQSVAANRFVSNPRGPLLSGKDLSSFGFLDTNGLYGKIIIKVEEMRDRAAIRDKEKAHYYIMKKFALSREAVEGKGLTTDKDKEQFFRAYNKSLSEGHILTVADACDFLANFKSESVFQALLDQSKEAVKAITGIDTDLSGVKLRLISAESLLIKIAEEQNKVFETAGIGPVENITTRYIVDQNGRLFSDRVGCYLASENTVYIVSENIQQLDSVELKNLINHELIHSAQLLGYPDYLAQIHKLEICRENLDSENSKKNLAYFQDLSASINARWQWLEQHAEYFENLDMDDSIFTAKAMDSPIKPGGIRKLLGLLGQQFTNRGFDQGAYENVVSMIKERSALPIEVINKIFDQPAFADILFRSDNTVYLPKEMQESPTIKEELLEFAWIYTKKVRLKIKHF